MALVAGRQEDVPDEGVDRGPADDADASEVLVEAGHHRQIDGDGQHAPEELLGLAPLLDDHHVVIGARSQRDPFQAGVQCRGKEGAELGMGD